MKKTLCFISLLALLIACKQKTLDERIREKVTAGAAESFRMHGVPKDSIKVTDIQYRPCSLKDYYNAAVDYQLRFAGQLIENNTTSSMLDSVNYIKRETQFVKELAEKADTTNNEFKVTYKLYYNDGRNSHDISGTVYLEKDGLDVLQPDLEKQYKAQGGK